MKLPRHIIYLLNMTYEMPGRSVFSWNTMMGGYSNSGLFDARDLFEMIERDVVSQTIVISRYAQNGNGDNVLALFGKML